MSLIIWRSREASDLLGHGNNRQLDIKTLWKFVITSYSTRQHRGELYLSILLTISDTDVSYMGSPSSLANPRAIFTACGTNTKNLIFQLKISRTAACCALLMLSCGKAVCDGPPQSSGRCCFWASGCLC